ncbi:hypothetical protein MKX01_011029 [Papaver californicum]|nr:hypothetical protein MKX01_011029 [Papaver californicum]
MVKIDHTHTVNVVCHSSICLYLVILPAVGDVLMDAASFLGGEVTLKILHMKLVMTLLPKLPLQHQLLQAPSSVCLTTGAYSKWLDASPNRLPVLLSVIEILMSVMSASEESAAAPALAFMMVNVLLYFKSSKRILLLEISAIQWFGWCVSHNTPGGE